MPITPAAPQFPLPESLVRFFRADRRSDVAVDEAAALLGMTGDALRALLQADGAQPAGPPRGRGRTTIACARASTPIRSTRVPSTTTWPTSSTRRSPRKPSTPSATTVGSSALTSTRCSIDVASGASRASLDSGAVIDPVHRSRLLQLRSLLLRRWSSLLRLRSFSPNDFGRDSYDFSRLVQVDGSNPPIRTAAGDTQIPNVPRSEYAPCTARNPHKVPAAPARRPGRGGRRHREVSSGSGLCYGRGPRSRVRSCASSLASASDRRRSSSSFSRMDEVSAAESPIECFWRSRSSR
jgi:hypothetical protein